MNCNRCPHRELVERARACCMACDPDAQSNHGVSHVQANDFTLSQAVNDHTPTTGVTSLPPDIEDTMRKFLSTLFSLDPTEMLLIQHLVRKSVTVNGQSESSSFANFRTFLGQVSHDIEATGDGSSSRAMACAKYKSIVKKFKVFEAVATGMIGRGHGGPGRPAKARKFIQMELGL